jgi:tripartite-type tricarboxylate transporter receptor subunit TctC
LYWLVSPDSDGLTDQHFLAAKWDSALASSIAVERAAAPIGWRDIAVLPITPQIQKGTRMNLRKRFLLVLLPVVLAASWAGLAQAQSPDGFPNRPIKIVVPFPPGGATDIIARVIAQKLTEQMGPPVIVENKAGANGNIAAEFVAKAQPDGYTLLYNTSSIALSPALYKKLNYDVRTDFAPVILTSAVPLLLSINPSVPANNIREFIDLMRAKPNALSYGSAGIGNITHLGSFLFLQSQGLVATHVPYKGSGPSVVATVAGEIQFNMEPLTVGLPYVKDKRIKAIAVTNLKRSSVLPEVPTLNETVMPGFEVATWQGILAPAKTPPEIVNRLNAEVTKALASAEVKEKLQAQGADLLGSTPEQYAAYLKSEIERWSKVVKSSGVQFD